MSLAAYLKRLARSEKWVVDMLGVAYTIDADVNSTSSLPQSYCLSEGGYERRL